MKHHYKDMFYNDLNDYNRLDSFKEEYTNSILTMLKEAYPNIDENTLNKYVDRYVAKHYSPSEVEVFIRDERTEDRIPMSLPIDNYLSLAFAENGTVSPSLTVYTKDEIAVDGKYMETNKKDRAIIKIAAAKAYADKDYVKADILNAGQKTKKIKNNAYTGGASLLHLPYATHTHHYSFTSTTAMMTGIGNTIAERFIGGNRLYFDTQSIIDEMHLVINNMRLEEWKLLKEYGVYIPTVDDLIEMITYSSNLYFELPIPVIRRYLNNYNEYQRMAFMYTGDFFHFDKFNPNISSNFLSESIKPIHSSSDTYREDFDLELLNSMDTSEQTHINLIFSDEMAGVKLGYEQHKDTMLGANMSLTIKHFRKLMLDFGFLFKPICNTSYLYVNTQRMKEAIRRVVPLSDTDSVTPVAQHWVNRAMYITSKKNYMAFRNGDRSPEVAKLFSRNQKKASPMTSLMSMITGYSTKHQLRMLGCEMNTKSGNYDVLEMKSEFVFDVFAPLPISKHYAQITKIKECFVFPKEKQEIDVSGVGLIANNASDRTKKAQQKVLNYIADAALEKSVTHQEVLGSTYQYELNTESIALGKTIIEDGKDVHPTELLNLVRVNPASEYKNPMGSIYFPKLLWNAFSDKYNGYTEETDVVYGYSLPLIGVDTPKGLKAWLDILDNELRKKLEHIIYDIGNKKGITRIIIPKEVFELHGIIDELKDIVDLHKIQSQALKPVYTTLSILGVNQNELSDVQLGVSHGDDRFLPSGYFDDVRDLNHED